jgi:predicted MFS family arabinose efflux permease
MTQIRVRPGVTLAITLLIQATASAAAIAPAVAAPRLTQALGVGTSAVGIYIAVLYLSAAMSSQFFSSLVRRWGPIRSSQLALALCAAGLVLVGVPNIAVALTGAVLLGAGYGPITPASSEVLVRTTPARRMAFVFSVKQTGVPLGGVIAGLTVPFVLDTVGAAWALGHIAAACVVSLALAQPIRARLDAFNDPRSPLPTLSTMVNPMRFIWADADLRRLALCTLVFSTAQVSLISYVVTFLNVELSWTLVSAGLALSVSQAAGVAGRVLWGAVADRWQAPRQTLIFLAVAMALFGVATTLLTSGTSHGWALLLLAAYGGTAVGWNGVYLAMVARQVPSEQAAMATAGSLFFTYAGIVCGAPLVGALGGMAGSISSGFALLALPLALAAWSLRREAPGANGAYPASPLPKQVE